MAHEIGADALNAIHLIATTIRNQDYIDRIENYGADREIICLHREGPPIAERITVYMEAKGVLKDCKRLVEQMAQVNHEM